MSKNVVKRKARPKRLFSKTGDDRLGLWIDLDLLRRQQKRPPQIVIHDPLSSVNNRYLELADVALGKAKSKKKSKGAAAE